MDDESRLEKWEAFFLEKGCAFRLCRWLTVPWLCRSADLSWVYSAWTPSGSRSTCFWCGHDDGPSFNRLTVGDHRSGWSWELSLTWHLDLWGHTVRRGDSSLEPIILFGALGNSQFFFFTVKPIYVPAINNSGSAKSIRGPPYHDLLPPGAVPPDLRFVRAI